MASKAEGGWTGAGGEANFQNALTNVENVVVFAKPGFDALDVLVDDVFIQSRHEATSFQATTNGYADITWSYVRSGLVYRLEYADNLASSWSTVTTVTASSTNVTTSVALTNTATRAYRLYLP